jgi:hypothetical protein
MGLHVNWLWSGTTLLVLAWGYAIAMLMFNRPKPEPLSINFIPGDSDNLDLLYHRAMMYCNEIIDHYQNTRYTTRRYYILSQILIATLSGLTPILVLIERDESLKAMMPNPLKIALTWAMLISPGIAAVLATTSTLFKFQEEWIQAKKTAESLEALREEFLLGASPAYQITATATDAKILQRKKALENFIIKVNELHLNQIDRWSSLQLTSAEPNTLPEVVQVETSAAPSGALTHIPAIALPAKRPEPSRSTPARPNPSDLSDDLLTEENLRIRPDRELSLDPPQQSQPTPEDDSQAATQSEENYLI